MRTPGNLRDRIQPQGPAVRFERASEPARGRLLTFVTVRLTGLILTVLVLGHFALTHIISDVVETDGSFVARRWSSAVWLTWDWLLLLTAIVHGAAGIWVVIDDYTPDPAKRRGRRIVLTALSTAALIIGTATIVTVIIRG